MPRHDEHLSTTERLRARGLFHLPGLRGNGRDVFDAYGRVLLSDASCFDANDLIAAIDGETTP